MLLKRWGEINHETRDPLAELPAGRLDNGLAICSTASFSGFSRFELNRINDKDRKRHAATWAPGPCFSFCWVYLKIARSSRALPAAAIDRRSRPAPRTSDAPSPWLRLVPGSDWPRIHP